MPAGRIESNGAGLIPAGSPDTRIPGSLETGILPPPKTQKNVLHPLTARVVDSPSVLVFYITIAATHSLLLLQLQSPLEIGTQLI